MIITNFDIKDFKTSETQPPDEGWEQLWSGYYWMSKCFSQQKRTDDVERERAIQAEGMINETEFQRNCLLSILADIKRGQVNMFELGAGWGRLCLTLAGIVDYKLFPITPASYRCLAMEGEPTHYQWAKEHFEIQGINTTLVKGAVSDKNGTCYFHVHPDPDSQYGQAINPLTSHRVIPSLHNIRNILTGKAERIPVYSVDHLLQAYGFDHVDIMQMDVQGAEYKVIQGAFGSIKSNSIDYILINVHAVELGKAIGHLLSPYFDLIVDIPRDSVGIVDGFAPIKCNDGHQLYKRKNI